MAEKKSWRDVYKVHPAADLFPMLPEDELRKLGEDIKANGLRSPIVLWAPGNNEADLIVRVMASAGLAKLAKPVKSRNAKGQVQGQATKDPIKEKAVEEGKKHRISKRTIERSIAKDRGPILQRRTRIEPGTIFAKGPGAMPSAAAKPTASKFGSVEDIVRKIMVFIERNLSDKSHETLSYVSEQLTAAIKDRIRSAPRKLSRPELNGEEVQRG
jgi:hypothetical protein